MHLDMGARECTLKTFKLYVCDSSTERFQSYFPGAFFQIRYSTIVICEICAILFYNPARTVLVRPI